MKLSSIIVATLLANHSSAFAPGFSGVRTSAVASSAVVEAPVKNVVDKGSSTEKSADVLVETPVVNPQSPTRIQLGRYADIEKSVALPFLKRPAALDGTHAGDYGFDPLGFTQDNDLYTMMESEIRHGRLAMLAVVGWPLAELLGPNWLLQGENHLSPSVLNGFSPVTFLATIAIFGGFGFFEYNTALRRVDNTELGRKHKEDMADVWNYGVPGDYNFDPLDFYNLIGDDARGRKGFREVEISHGRMAMLGITYFAMWEYITGCPIVENNPLFHPNLLVPILGIAYLSFGFFFEVKNTDEVLFKIETTSEGESRIARISTMFEGVGKNSGENLGTMFDVGESLIENLKGLKKKYDNLNESYTNSVMNYAKDEKKF